MTDILNAVVNSVGNYRNHKTEVLNKTPLYLKQYVNQYFSKADSHFERLMDICINIPETVSVIASDSGQYLINYHGIEYALSMQLELTDNDFQESEYLFEVFKRIRLVKN